MEPNIFFAPVATESILHVLHMQIHLPVNGLNYFI